jgi:hypothetical protein
MPRNTTQVIFECSEDFRKRLHQEKLKRGIAVKRMIIEALEAYWLWPYDAKPGDVITLELNPYDTAEKRHWADMMVEYIERCPSDKVRLLQSVIELDLKQYRAGRKKKSVLDIKRPQRGSTDTEIRVREVKTSRKRNGKHRAGGGENHS